MPDERCPICHSKLTPEQKWTHDPIHTLKGLAGNDYKDIQYIKKIDIKELQEERKQQEQDFDISEDEQTEFTEIPDVGEIFIPNKKHIRELRQSTEKLLETLDVNLGEYFNYDEEGNYIGTYKYGEKIADKSEWTRIDRNIVGQEGEPYMPEDMTHIYALDIEELRHIIPLIRWEQIYWGSYPKLEYIAPDGVPYLKSVSYDIPKKVDSIKLHNWIFNVYKTHSWNYHFGLHYGSGGASIEWNNNTNEYYSTQKATFVSDPISDYSWGKAFPAFSEHEVLFPEKVKINTNSRIRLVYSGSNAIYFRQDLPGEYAPGKSNYLLYYGIWSFKFTFKKIVSPYTTYLISYTNHSSPTLPAFTIPNSGDITKNIFTDLLVAYPTLQPNEVELVKVEINNDALASVFLMPAGYPTIVTPEITSYISVEKIIVSNYGGNG